MMGEEDAMKARRHTPERVIRKLPEAVELTGRYPLAWAPYSMVPGAGRGEFRWTHALVARADDND